MGKISHLLFDCDNTLVLSEKLAFEACAELANQILEKYNIDARYTGPQLLSDFVGQNFRGMVTNVQKRHGFTLSPEELETYVLMEEDRVIATLERKAEPCIGATEGLEKLHETGKYGMAVVSSSARRRVKASIKKVGQDKFFPDDHIFSAATSLEKPTSKPDPAIYMHACKVLNKQPCECIAVEDSKSGTLSAVRAGIPVLGYVGCYDNEEQTEMRKLLADTGAWVIMNEWHEIMECLVEMERLAAEKQAAEKQATEKQATEKQATENQATEKQATEKLC